MTDISNEVRGVEPLTDSILNLTKKNLGLSKDYDAFDSDIIVHINSVFNKLHQLGVGPLDGYAIESDQETWTDYLNGDKRINLIKTYTYLQVRIWFDPPQTSFHLESMKQQIQEMEWRINYQREEDVWIQQTSMSS